MVTGVSDVEPFSATASRGRSFAFELTTPLSWTFVAFSPKNRPSFDADPAFPC